MSLGAKVATNLPYLRRYARALTGSQSTGDAFVRATLEAALADGELRALIGEGRPQLYHAFHRVWSSGFVDTGDRAGAGGGRGARVGAEGRRAGGGARRGGAGAQAGARGGRGVDGGRVLHGRRADQREAHRPDDVPVGQLRRGALVCVVVAG